MAIVGSFADVIKPFRLRNPHRLNVSLNAVTAANDIYYLPLGSTFWESSVLTAGRHSHPVSTSYVLL